MRRSSCTRVSGLRMCSTRCESRNSSPLFPENGSCVGAHEPRSAVVSRLTDLGNGLSSATEVWFDSQFIYLGQRARLYR